MTHCGHGDTMWSVQTAFLVVVCWFSRGDPVFRIATWTRRQCFVQRLRLGPAHSFDFGPALALRVAKEWPKVFRLCEKSKDLQRELRRKHAVRPANVSCAVTKAAARRRWHLWCLQCVSKTLRLRMPSAGEVFQKFRSVLRSKYPRGSKDSKVSH